MKKVSLRAEYEENFDIMTVDEKALVVRTLDEEGFDENNIYGRQARLHLLEDEEISSREQAFMNGYEDSDEEL